MKKLLAVCLAATLLSVLPAHFAHASDTLPSSVDYSDLDREIEEYVSRNEETTAGMAVSVFEEDTVLYSDYFGHSDLEEDSQVTEDTVFEWGSISKLLIWVSVFQLWEDGEIELDEDVRGYLSDELQSELQYDTEVTMLNLMHHDAGFEDSMVDLFVSSLPEDYSLESAVLESEPSQIYEPGAVTAYSNWGTALAALVVEEISGMSYEDYVHEHIFEPLDMDRTALYPDLSDNEWVQENRGMTESYFNTIHLNDNPSVVQLYPAGMGTGAMSDLVAFGQAIMPDDEEETPLFDEYSTLEEMLTPSDYYGDTDDPKNRHGFWEAVYDVPVTGHSGGTSGFSANFVFDIESGIGTVVMTNQTMEQTYTGEMLDVIYGEFQNTAADVPEGLYQSARTIDDGPFSFMKFQMTVMGEEDLNDYWVHTDGSGIEAVEYPTVDFIKLGGGESFLRIAVLVLLFAGIVYSFASLVIVTVKSLFFRNRLREDTARLPNVILNLLILILMVNFITVVIRFILYAPSTALAWHYYLFFALLILLPLSAVWLIRRAGLERPLLSKITISSTVFLAAFGLFFIFYFDLYQFWLV